MAGFAKLFGSIVTSSIWCHDDKTLRIWIAMLATCDSEGIVEGSVPGFASLCRVDIPALEHALEILMGPDAHSRTPDHEGRRVEALPGGWRILNYRAYRDRGQAKEGSKAPYMREHRKAKAAGKEVTSGNALPGKVTCCTEAEAEAVKEKEKEVRRIPGPLNPPSPGAKAVASPRVKKLKTTELKADSVEAFQAAWDTMPATVMRWDASARRDVEAPVAKGSRAESERNFQAIVDAGLAQPRTLYVAFYAYITEGEGPRKGYIQHLATFFGTKKATWREWLERAKALETERYGRPA